MVWTEGAMVWRENRGKRNSKNESAGGTKSAGDGIDGEQELRDELIGFFRLLHAMITAPHFE